MPPELLNLLIQIPMVAAFIWYSERMNKQFMDFMREERAARDKALEALGVKIQANTDCLEEHDRKMGEAVAVMRERTKPREIAT